MGLYPEERKGIAKALRRYLETEYVAATKDSREYILLQIQQFEDRGISNVENKEDFITFIKEALE